jgi:emopamil binding protein
MGDPMRLPIPLSRRPLDVALVAFFAVNLCFTTYVVSLEQIVIADPSSFVPPPWPPARLLALVHWWERSFDPLLLARPAWYRATIWLDVLVFGPFYAVAIYAFVRGRDWVRLPCLVWASMLFTNVFIILFDELKGIHATPSPALVFLANAPWLLVPILVGWRVARSEHPFTREGAGAAAPRAA